MQATAKTATRSSSFSWSWRSSQEPRPTRLRPRPRPRSTLLFALTSVLLASLVDCRVAASQLSLTEIAREGRGILRREETDDQTDDKEIYAQAVEKDPNITDMFCEEGKYFMGIRDKFETMHSAYTIPGIVPNMTNCVSEVNRLCYTATGALWNTYAEQCLCLFGPLKGRNATNGTHMCKFKHESCQGNHWNDGMPMKILQKRQFVGVVSSGEACVNLVKANPHCCGTGDSTTMAFLTKVLPWDGESQGCECLVGLNSSRYMPGRERKYAACSLVKREKYAGKCWTKSIR